MPPNAKEFASEAAVTKIFQEYHGQMVTERRIAQKLGIGRSTVREALARLRELGFATTEKGIGTVIKSITRRRAEEMIEMRKILEPQVAFYLCQRQSPALLAPVEKKHDEFLKLTEPGNKNVRISNALITKINRCDREWHVATMQAQNGYVADQIERIFRETSILAISGLHDGRMLADLQAEHNRIMRAIRNPKSTLQQIQRAYHAHLDRSLDRWHLIV